MTGTECLSHLLSGSQLCHLSGTLGLAAGPRMMREQGQPVLWDGCRSVDTYARWAETGEALACKAAVLYLGVCLPCARDTEDLGSSAFCLCLQRSHKV